MADDAYTVDGYQVQATVEGLPKTTHADDGCYGVKVCLMHQPRGDRAACYVFVQVKPSDYADVVQLCNHGTGVQAIVHEDGRVAFDHDALDGRAIYGHASVNAAEDLKEGLGIDELYATKGANDDE